MNKDNPNNSTHRVIFKNGVYYPQYWYKNTLFRIMRLDYWEYMKEPIIGDEHGCSVVQEFKTKEKAIEYIVNKTKPKEPEEVVVFEVNVNFPNNL